MKVLFNVFLGLMCLMAGVSAQFGECVTALKSYESTSEGQAITNCVELAKASDISICSHSECQQLELPSRFKSICTDPEGEVVYKTLELNFNQINAVVKKVCKNDNSGLNSLKESTQSIVNDDKKSSSSSSPSSSDNKSSDSTATNSNPTDTTPASTTPVTTVPANATAEGTINGLPNAAPSSIKISSSLVCSMVLITISLLFKY